MTATAPRLLLAALTLAVPAAVGAADDPEIAAGPQMSGAWYDPGNDGSGLMLEVLDNGRAAVTWYTFDANGAPLWLAGVGAAETGRVIASLYSVDAGRFPSSGPHATNPSRLWGEVVLSFHDCNSGTLAWDPVQTGYATGLIPLHRLTSIGAHRCGEEAFGENRVFNLGESSPQMAALFSDYPEGGEEQFELVAEHGQVPAPLTAWRGIRLSGNNKSDDLAMFLKRRVAGLEPLSEYLLEIDLEIASNAPTGCSGVGGSPGDSVFIKLGASTTEPEVQLSAERGDDRMRLTIDVGEQSASGRDAVVAGTLGVSNGSCGDPANPWQLKTLHTRGRPHRVRTDAEGALWLVAGSDSAFEGLSTWYATRLVLRLQRVRDTLSDPAPRE